MLAAQQQQIMALQAQVHEQGGSAQGEAQHFECCNGVGASLRAMLAAQQQRITAVQDQGKGQVNVELCCCNPWELMLRPRQVHCKLSNLAIGCFPAAPHPGPARVGPGWQGAQ